MRRPDPNNEAIVVLRRESLVGPILGRVVGMLAARADAPVDRLDDVLLVSDAIAAHGPAHSGDDSALRVEVRTTPDRLSLRVGPLAPDGGRALIEAAELPGVGNIVQQVASDVTVESGQGGLEHLVIHVALGDSRIDS
jgi:serine/threonine-protein kinase RsbW